MITITLKGDDSKAVAKAAAQIATLFQTAGKIVRVYKETPPDPIPLCNVAILVTSEDK